MPSPLQRSLATSRYATSFPSGRPFTFLLTRPFPQIMRELVLFTTMRHPFIIIGLEAFQDASSIFLIQEFAARGDLCDLCAAYPKRKVPENIVSTKARARSPLQSPVSPAREPAPGASAIQA